MAISGSQHAQRAEDLLRDAEQERHPVEKANLLANAQVHATLALLAATVHNNASRGAGGDDGPEGPATRG